MIPDRAAIAAGCDMHATAELVPDELNRVWRAMMLANDLETCEALIRGETVPIDRLDPDWIARFGRRQ